MSGVRVDVHTPTTTYPSPGVVDATRERADIAAANPTSLTPSTREQITVGHVVTSPESSPMPEQYVAASSPTTNPHAVAQRSISTAVALPSRPTQLDRMSTTFSEVSSPSIGASQSPKVNPAQSPVLGRGKPDRRAPKRSVAGSTTGSASIAPSKYTDMVFEEVPLLDNILAGFFVWMLLAGFVVLPGAFDPLNNAINNSEVHQILSAIHRIRKLVAGYGCCGIGAIGMFYLWLRWSHNYVWLLGNIFIPGLLNSLTGVLAAFAIIYSDVPGGSYNTTSIITLGVTGGCAVICGILAAIYWLWKLRRVKRQHGREMEQANTEEVG